MYVRRATTAFNCASGGLLAIDLDQGEVAKWAVAYDCEPLSLRVLLAVSARAVHAAQALSLPPDAQ